MKIDKDLLSIHLYEMLYMDIHHEVEDIVDLFCKILADRICTILVYDLNLPHRVNMNNSHPKIHND